MNRVKKLKERLGMTQEQFAEYCGISRSSIARYETGAEISRINAEKIANVCHVSIDYVLGKNDKEPVAKSDELRESIVNLLLDLPEADVEQVRDYAAWIKSRHEKE